MPGPDGTLQRVTVQNAMQEVTYTTHKEKYYFLSFMRMLERECQITCELIPTEDVDLRTAFYTFHLL
jgi:hypothetical protein